MFFNSLKHGFKWGVLILAIPFFVSCAKESEPEDTPIVIDLKSDSTQCLTEISSTFNSYLEGELSESALREFWLCTRDAIQLFLDVTKGKKSGGASYSSYEIKRFLEEYFLDGYTLSATLVEEIMHLKRLFVAGDLNEVTRAELQELQKVISEVEELTVYFLPHVKPFIKSITEPETSKLSLEEVQNLEAQIKEVTQRFADIVIRHNQAYSVARLQSLIREVEKIFSDTPEEDSIARFFPLVEQAKLLLVNKDTPTVFGLSRLTSSVVTADEWPRLMKVTSDLLGFFIRYRLFVEQGDWRKEEGLEQLHHIIISAEGLLRSALADRTNSYYEAYELVEFVNSLRDIGLLPDQFDHAAITSVVETLINKLLVVGSEPHEENRFSLNHLNQLRSEYWRWKAAQDYLEQLEKGKIKLSEASSNPGVEEMRQVLNGPWALVQDDLGRLIFSFQPVDRSNLQSRSILNLARAGIRLIIQGYATEPSRKASLEGITNEELHSVEQDLHPLLQALGLVKEGESIAGRLFLEANLFMPRADGDDYLGFAEGIEYLSFVLSGLSASNLIFDDLKLQCPTIVEDETTKIAIDCFRSKVSESRKKYLEHLPHLVTYLDLGTSDLWKSIEINLERTIREDDLSLPISQGEVLQMWVLLQYVETFFGRFDANQNTSVDLNEALESYEVFRATLENLLTGALSDEEGVLAFFTFTMNYGETPFTAKWGGELKFLNWKWSKERWSFEANRLRVLKILAALNELT